MFVLGGSDYLKSGGDISLPRFCVHVSCICAIESYVMYSPLYVFSYIP